MPFATSSSSSRMAVIWKSKGWTPRRQVGQPGSAPESEPSSRARKLSTSRTRRALPAADATPKPLLKEASVRVPATRLDQLVNLVGELVMNQSRLSEATSRANAPELTAPVEELERLISELRDNVLGIRMMPIGTIFGRFRRLVHELSTTLGKEIDLVTEGAATELDKSILDQLGEPLVHLLRNSIDHGIESPDDRIRAGKPRRGRSACLPRIPAPMSSLESRTTDAVWTASGFAPRRSRSN